VAFGRVCEPVPRLTLAAPRCDHRSGHDNADREERHMLLHLRFRLLRFVAVVILVLIAAG
jgi:hypothetical protein